MVNVASASIGTVLVVCVKVGVYVGCTVKLIIGEDFAVTGVIVGIWGVSVNFLLIGGVLETVKEDISVVDRSAQALITAQRRNMTTLFTIQRRMGKVILCNKASQWC